MKLLRYAVEHGKRPLAWAAVLGALGGVSSTALLTLTAKALGSDTTTARDVMAFVALTLGAAVVRYVSATISVRFTNTEQAEMAYDLSRRVLRAPLRRVEELGGDRLLASLTDDLAFIIRAMMELPVLVTNSVVVIGCFAYLAFFSWSFLVLVLACAVLAIAPHRVIARIAHEKFTAARLARNELMGHYRALTDGITELKLHRGRRAAFLTEALKAVLESITRLNIEGQRLYNIGNGYRQSVFMLAAAPIIFGAPFLQVDRATAMAAVLTLFYLRGPLESMMSMVPIMARADIALQNYEAVRAALPAEHYDGAVSSRPIARASRIDLVDVRYTYPGAEGFSIGPINLTIRAGEILFIAGGNGSGKTTLAKVIAGLYEPTAGALYVDGRPVDTRNRDEFRQLTTCVFAKFHLFRRLLGVDHRNVERRADVWLRRLNLDRVMRIEDGVFSTLELSTGQRKRMALLLAMIDDRPICIFDEWAAEQDPQYRNEFYTSVLPELKAAGKTVVVITHDDRYFKTGDRLIRMEHGRIVSASGPRLEADVVAAARPVAVGRSI